jgi:apolipoprotein D and lipocalin family protein
MRHPAHTPAHTRTLRQAAWAAALLALLLGGIASPAQAAPDAPLEAVPAIELSRYAGRWYQVAHYPNRFQRQCVAATMADYALLPDGRVQVTNRCLTAEGQLSEAVGIARKPRGLSSEAPGTTPPFQLEVRFAPAWLSWWPAVWAPYWVIQLADDLRYAVVGEPDRAYLWILARTPRLSASDRAAIDQRLREQGYDPTRLKEEAQP